jgi:hypothetical protein
MTDIAEVILALACWAVSFAIYFYILPKMREHHGWHVMGLNVFGAFGGYLGVEVITDSSWVDAHYNFYLFGNAMFPIAAGLVVYGYWRDTRMKRAASKTSGKSAAKKKG